MCSNYFPTLSRQRLTTFGVQPEFDLAGKRQVWKSYPAPMVRMRGDDRELLLGEFGLLPFWSKERKIKYSTFNARSETVETASSFKTPWAKRQRCIIPADFVVEPDWRSGKNVPTAISRSDGQPMGLAGLWDCWTDRTTGEIVHSFTMLTINADSHGLMRNFHRPDDEKRMVVVLPEERYGDWLTLPNPDARSLILPYPADALQALPVAELGSRDGDVL
ncbi:SOS response-associated peptidase [Serratia nevei]|uniref:SOS response-associated peptidase n=1 Tax=Serratia nevei TaxID=2703794 RepID=UPI00254E6F06|nr:SOS response-associated peptidase family protein [Serratia nevei]MDK5165470.1 SOS response-associated peptidase family protein [Serratia nevei]